MSAIPLKADIGGYGHVQAGNVLTALKDDVMGLFEKGREKTGGRTSGTRNKFRRRRFVVCDRLYASPPHTPTNGDVRLNIRIWGSYDRRSQGNGANPTTERKVLRRGRNRSLRCI